MWVKWLSALAIAAAVFALSIHQIPEGHVGIYYRSVARRLSPLIHPWESFMRLLEEELCLPLSPHLAIMSCYHF